jgi:hypothetical protein
MGTLLEPLARLGYASKAVIYAIVGVLAILTAVERGGQVTDTSGALRVVLTQPFGRLLLLVLAVGLCGYAVWRLADAALDPDRHGTGPSGLVDRIGNVVRGGVYGTLGVEAFRLFRGLGGSNGDEARIWTARILDYPLGAVAVGLAGAIVAVYGVSQVAKGVRGKGDAKVDLSPIAPAARTAVRRISRFGVAVRGALIATLGGFLVKAAITSNPTEAAGARESLLWLGSLAEGRWLLAIIAAGVLAYAVDQAVHARCRRIRPVM